MKKQVINKAVVVKVLKVVDKGLCEGMGEPTPGKMCVEAAVNYALGEEWGDEPSCVYHSIRDFKIHVNDGISVTNKMRSKLLRRLSIAQLGTAGVLSMRDFNDIASRAIATAYYRRHLDTLNKQKNISWDDFNDIQDLDNVSLNDAFDYYIDKFGDGGTGKKYRMAINDACEIVVQVLVKMKAKGTKFLSLAPFKAVT